MHALISHTSQTDPLLPFENWKGWNLFKKQEGKTEDKARTSLQQKKSLMGNINIHIFLKQSRNKMETRRKLISKKQRGIRWKSFGDHF